MSFYASLIVKRDGWEGCLIFEVEVMSMLGVSWLGLGLGSNIILVWEENPVG